MKTVMGEKCS